MARRLALVTGASSGIGKALAREYAANGWDVALTARREERLRSIASDIEADFSVDTLVVPADLADPAAPEAIVKAIDEAGRDIDALVNNAGFGLPGLYTQSSWKAQSDFIQLMFTSYAELAHRVLPGMQERGFGRILNVASVAGIMPGSRGHTLYSAVKSALIKFSQSLHLENKETGVHASALCPGFTYSEFHDVNQTRAMVSKMPAYWWLSAEQVAQAGYDAVQANRAVCVPGLWYKFLTGLNQVLPGPISLWMMEGSSKRVRLAEAPPAADAPAADEG